MGTINGTTSTPRMRKVRYRIGPQSGDVFSGQDCYDGETLTIEVANRDDGLAMVDAIGETDRGWKPIINAPKDQIVDLFHNTMGRLCDCQYKPGSVSEGNDWLVGVEEQGMSFTADLNGDLEDITHFRLRPLPPTES